MSKLKDVAYITKLAGFEHTKYIQGNCTHEKRNEDDKPLFIGKTVRNGIIDKNFDWYINSDISEELPRSQLNKKCIVLPYVGSVGDLAIFDGTYKAHLGSNIAKLELNDNSEFSEEFIYYYLKSPFGQKNLLKDIQGAVQKNITMDAIRNVEIPNIEKSIQNKIVNILLRLDNKILNNSNIISELESMAKTIYDYWFLQFEFPNKDGKPYKSSGGKTVWNEELKQEIPEGWNVKKVSEILSKIPNTYKYISSEYKTDGKFPIIDQSSNYICGYTNKEEDLLKLEDCVVFGDHTKFVKYVNFDFARGADGTQILDSSDDKLPNYLLYMQISNMQLVSQGYSRYYKFLKDKYVIIPKKEISDRYMSKVKTALEKLRKCREENKELCNLRDYLLPLLMNGQVGFKD